MKLPFFSDFSAGGGHGGNHKVKNKPAIQKIDIVHTGIATPIGLDFNGLFNGKIDKEFEDVIYSRAIASSNYSSFTADAPEHSNSSISSKRAFKRHSYVEASYNNNSSNNNPPHNKYSNYHNDDLSHQKYYFKNGHHGSTGPKLNGESSISPVKGYAKTPSPHNNNANNNYQDRATTTTEELKNSNGFFGMHSSYREVTKDNNNIPIRLNASYNHDENNHNNHMYSSNQNSYTAKTAGGSAVKSEGTSMSPPTRTYLSPKNSSLFNGRPPLRSSGNNNNNKHYNHNDPASNLLSSMMIGIGGSNKTPSLYDSSSITPNTCRLNTSNGDGRGSVDGGGVNPARNKMSGLTRMKKFTSNIPNLFGGHGSNNSNHTSVSSSTTAQQRVGYGDNLSSNTNNSGFLQNSDSTNKKKQRNVEKYENDHAINLADESAAEDKASTLYGEIISNNNHTTTKGELDNNQRNGSIIMSKNTKTSKKSKQATIENVYQNSNNNNTEIISAGGNRGDDFNPNPYETGGTKKTRDNNGSGVKHSIGVGKLRWGSLGRDNAKKNKASPPVISTPTPINNNVSASPHNNKNHSYQRGDPTPQGSPPPTGDSANREKISFNQKGFLISPPFTTQLPSANITNVTGGGRSEKKSSREDITFIDNNNNNNNIEAVDINKVYDEHANLTKTIERLRSTTADNSPIRDPPQRRLFPPTVANASTPSPPPPVVFKRASGGTTNSGSLSSYQQQQEERRKEDQPKILKAKIAINPFASYYSNQTQNSYPPLVVAAARPEAQEYYIRPKISYVVPVNHRIVNNTNSGDGESYCSHHQNNIDQYDGIEESDYSATLAMPLKRENTLIFKKPCGSDDTKSLDTPAHSNEQHRLQQRDNDELNIRRRDGTSSPNKTTVYLNQNNKPLYFVPLPQPPLKRGESMNLPQTLTPKYHPMPTSNLNIISSSTKSPNTSSTARYYGGKGNEEDAGVLSEMETSNTRYGSKLLSGFNLFGRNTAYTHSLDRRGINGGVVYLRWNDETKRMAMPQEGFRDVNSIKDLFGKTFKHLDVRFRERQCTVYIQDVENPKELFYELEDVNDITNKSILKLVENRGEDNNNNHHRSRGDYVPERIQGNKSTIDNDISWSQKQQKQQHLQKQREIPLKVEDDIGNEIGHSTWDWERRLAEKDGKEIIAPNNHQYSQSQQQQTKMIRDNSRISGDRGGYKSEIDGYYDFYDTDIENVKHRSQNRYQQSTTFQRKMNENENCIISGGIGKLDNSSKPCDNNNTNSSPIEDKYYSADAATAAAYYSEPEHHRKYYRGRFMMNYDNADDTDYNVNGTDITQAAKLYEDDNDNNEIYGIGPKNSRYDRLIQENSSLNKAGYRDFVRPIGSSAANIAIDPVRASSLSTLGHPSNNNNNNKMAYEIPLAKQIVMTSTERLNHLQGPPGMTKYQNSGQGSVINKFDRQKQVLDHMEAKLKNKNVVNNGQGIDDLNDLENMIIKPNLIIQWENSDTRFRMEGMEEKLNKLSTLIQNALIRSPTSKAGDNYLDVPIKNLREIHDQTIDVRVDLRNLKNSTKFHIFELHHFIHSLKNKILQIAKYVPQPSFCKITRLFCRNDRTFNNNFNHDGFEEPLTTDIESIYTENVGDLLKEIDIYKQDMAKVEKIFNEIEISIEEYKNDIVQKKIHYHMKDLETINLALNFANRAVNDLKNRYPKLERVIINGIDLNDLTFEEKTNYNKERQIFLKIECEKLRNSVNRCNKLSNMLQSMKKIISDDKDQKRESFNRSPSNQSFVSLKSNEGRISNNSLRSESIKERNNHPDYDNNNQDKRYFNDLNYEDNHRTATGTPRSYYAEDFSDSQDRFLIQHPPPMTRKIISQPPVLRSTLTSPVSGNLSPIKEMSPNNSAHNILAFNNEQAGKSMSKEDANYKYNGCQQKAMMNHQNTNDCYQDNSLVQQLEELTAKIHNPLDMNKSAGNASITKTQSRIIRGYEERCSTAGTSSHIDKQEQSPLTGGIQVQISPSVSSTEPSSPIVQSYCIYNNTNNNNTVRYNDQSPRGPEKNIDPPPPEAPPLPLNQSNSCGSSVNNYNTNSPINHNRHERNKTLTPTIDNVEAAMAACWGACRNDGTLLQDKKRANNLTLSLDHTTKQRSSNQQMNSNYVNAASSSSPKRDFNVTLSNAKKGTYWQEFADIQKQIASEAARAKQLRTAAMHKRYAAASKMMNSSTNATPDYTNYQNKNGNELIHNNNKTTSSPTLTNCSSSVASNYSSRISEEMESSRLSLLEDDDLSDGDRAKSSSTRTEKYLNSCVINKRRDEQESFANNNDQGTCHNNSTNNTNNTQNSSYSTTREEEDDRLIKKVGNPQPYLRNLENAAANKSVIGGNEHDKGNQREQRDTAIVIKDMAENITHQIMLEPKRNTKIEDETDIIIINNDLSDFSHQNLNKSSSSITSNKMAAAANEDSAKNKEVITMTSKITKNKIDPNILGNLEGFPSFLASSDHNNITPTHLTNGTGIFDNKDLFLNDGGSNGYENTKNINNNNYDIKEVKSSAPPSAGNNNTSSYEYLKNNQYV